MFSVFLDIFTPCIHVTLFYSCTYQELSFWSGITWVDCLICSADSYQQSLNYNLFFVCIPWKISLSLSQPNSIQSFLNSSIVSSGMKMLKKSTHPKAVHACFKIKVREKCSSLTRDFTFVRVTLFNEMDKEQWRICSFLQQSALLTWSNTFQRNVQHIFCMIYDKTAMREANHIF